VIGAHQADSLKDHTHLYNNPVYSAAQTGGGTPGTTGANYATTIRPPFVPEGCVAIFNGGLSAVGEWRIELAANQMSAVGAEKRAQFAN